MNLKKIFCCVLLFLSTTAMAQFSANLGAVSDYVWRGISQTDEDPALQGGVDYAANNGFYVGAWGSNVDKPLDVELDGYMGFSNELDSGFGYDLGYIYYKYTGESDADFGEGYLGFSYKIFAVKYSNDFENDNAYLEGNFDIPLGNGFGLGLHYGTYDFDSGAEYDDYKVGFTKDFKGFSFELAYTDTDIDHSPIADGRVYLGISKSWDF